VTVTVTVKVAVKVKGGAEERLSASRRKVQRRQQLAEHKEGAGWQDKTNKHGLEGSSDGMRWKERAETRGWVR